MTEKDSKESINQALEDDLFEQPIGTETSADDNKFDKMQADFNALITEQTASGQTNVQPDQQSVEQTEEQSNQQNDAVIADLNQQLEASSFEAKTANNIDPFADNTPLTDPMNTDSIDALATPPALEPDSEASQPIAPIDDNEALKQSLLHHVDDDFFSHLDDEPGLKSEQHSPVAQSSDSESESKIFLSASDLSATDTSNVANTSQADPFTESDAVAAPINHNLVTETANNPAMPAAVHADISGHDAADHQRNSGKFIVLTATLLLAAAAGAYWLITGTPDPASTPPAQETTTLATHKAIPETSNAVNNSDKPQLKQEQAGLKQTEQKQTELKKTEPQNAEQHASAAKTKKTTAISEQVSVKNTSLKQATQQQQSAQKPTKIAMIQPSTPLQDQPAKAPVVIDQATDTSGNWIIRLAAVNSNKSGRQHVARFNAMGIKSESVQVNIKGRVFHHIRITGFSSKQQAQTQLHKLNKTLGSNRAKVEKL